MKIKRIILSVSLVSLVVIVWPTALAEKKYAYQLTSDITPIILPVIKNIEKKIEINLSRQNLALWENDKKIAEYIVSTGKKSTPTKTGSFSVISIYPTAYGGDAAMTWGMPYFLGIYVAGGQENGIHELPFINGWRESSADLGYPVSHGCVRLPIGKAELVYNWAEIGTPVNIHY